MECENSAKPITFPPSNESEGFQVTFVMSKIKKLIDFLNPLSLQTFLYENTKKIIVSNDDLFLDQNREQLRQSRRADNSKITPLYSQRYAQKKGFKNPNLRDTGQYYNNFFLEIEGDTIIIRSERFESGFDVRAALIERYGNKIEGVSVQFLEQFCNEILLPELERLLLVRLAL